MLLLRGHMTCFGIQTYVWYAYLPRCPILSCDILWDPIGNSRLQRRNAAFLLIRARWPRLIVWHSIVFLLGEGHNLQHFLLITSIPEVDRLWRWRDTVGNLWPRLPHSIAQNLYPGDFTPFHLLYHNPHSNPTSVYGMSNPRRTKSWRIQHLQPQIVWLTYVYSMGISGLWLGMIPNPNHHSSCEIMINEIFRVM
jgi:hypothetical protein